MNVYRSNCSSLMLTHSSRERFPHGVGVDVPHDAESEGTNHTSSTCSSLLDVSMLLVELLGRVAANDLQEHRLTTALSCTIFSPVEELGSKPFAACCGSHHDSLHVALARLHLCIHAHTEGRNLPVAWRVVKAELDQANRLARSIDRHTTSLQLGLGELLVGRPHTADGFGLTVFAAKAAALSTEAIQVEVRHPLKTVEINVLLAQRLDPQTVADLGDIEGLLRRRLHGCFRIRGPDFTA